MSLFNQRLLKTVIDKFVFPVYEKRKRADEIIQGWQTAFKNHDLSKAKETSLQGKFFSKFFCEILGYTMQDDGGEIWTLKQESKTEVDGKEADGSLGFYSKNSSQTRAVIELKDAQCNLDAKQCSRENKQTPVEQAFQYLYKFADCDWVIVSNFRYTRLYHKSKGQTVYEEFDILTLNEEKEFKKFYYCLSRENLIDKNANSSMDLLIKHSGVADIDITKEFYTDFKKVRKILFEHIVENNPDYDKKLLLGKTQKLLDRFIFIFFCEDTAGLLPHNTVENIYKNAKNSFSMSQCRIWDEFRGLFAAIDKGNNNVNPPINAYNGGLFAPDEILDRLIIKDDIFKHIEKLSRYDFESDLNVNILGHIFEQSLSDLEHLKNEIDGIEEDKKNSKRKKDGIFYTPEYITHYIVEETIGRYLDENPDKLETIKILDPACGSGAFLNQAHEFLRKQHKIKIEEKINAEKSSKRGGQEFLQTNLLKHSNLAENDRSILLNNIFGVDLNKESVEITKLALWLKTAHPKYKLQNLDENIKCGNSLIDDPNIAGEKAFKWENEFKDIMDNGGFDVIIGNPPYFNIDTFGHNSPVFEYLKTAYSDIYMDKSDILFYFIKRAIDLLRSNGILGFIISNAFLFSDKAKKLRNYILDKCSILKIVNFEQYQVFKDAGITTCILILQKANREYEANVISLKEKNETEDLIIQKIQQPENYFACNFEKDKPFALVNNKIAEINAKIDGRHKKLGEILHVGKGMETAANEVFSFKTYPSNFSNKFIRNRMSGEIISRYYIAEPLEHLLYFEDVENFGDLPVSIQQYLLENKDFLENRAEIRRNNGSKWWSYTFPLHKEYYQYDKIWCSYRAKDNAFVYDDTKNFIGLTNTTAIFGNNSNYNLKYILALLNSQLLNFWHKSNAKQTGNGVFEYVPNVIEKIPIPDISKEQQQPLSQKAEEMIELNKKLHEESQNALELIELEYKPKKLTQKLENFYTLGLNPFLDELQKQGAKLSLSKKEELIAWYKEKSNLLNCIKTQIQNLDNEIDKEVYELYGMTDEEIKIIESS